MTMNPTNLPRLLVAALPVLLAACSSQQLYAVGQGWQQQECRKLADVQERARCEKSSAMSFERYRAERDAAQAGGKTPP